MNPATGGAYEKATEDNRVQTKKLLGSALALAMMWPGQASAELLKNLKMSGSFEVQGIRANNVTDFRTQNIPTGGTGRDEMADVQHRIIVSLDYDLLDDVHARTTLRKNDRNYGDEPAGGRGSQNITEIEANVFLDEAWVKVDKVFGSMDLTMGRQFLGTPGDIIAYYGPKEKLYGMPVDALDMMRADWAGENFTVSALAGKPRENGAAGANGTIRFHDEQDIRAVLFGLRGQENIAAGAYLWNVEQHRNAANVGNGPTEATDGGRNSRLWIVGVKAKAMAGPAWIGAEFAKNYGVIREDGTTQVAPTASAVGWAALMDLGAKLDVDGVAAFTPWGRFAMGTGRQNTRENRNEDFQAVNPDFRPGILYGRFGTGANSTIGAGLTNGFASNSLSNRVIWGAGLKVNPAAVNKLTAGLSFWDFRRHRATFGPNTEPTNMGQKHFGSEIDLDLTWDHSDNVQFGVGAGRFMPGQYIHTDRQATTGLFASANSQRGVNPAYAGYFDVKIKWGGQQ